MNTFVTRMLPAVTMMAHFYVPANLDSVESEQRAATSTNVTPPLRVTQILLVQIQSAHSVAAATKGILETAHIA